MKRDKLAAATQAMYRSYNATFDNWMRKHGGLRVPTSDILQEFIDEHFMLQDAETGKTRSDATAKQMLVSFEHQIIRNPLQ